MNVVRGSEENRPECWSENAPVDSVRRALEQTNTETISLGRHLRQVMDRYPERAYIPNPVGRAVVEAILLDAGFQRLSPKLWNGLVDQVSTTLHDDPASLRRLQNIWGNR